MERAVHEMNPGDVNQNVMTALSKQPLPAGGARSPLIATYWRPMVLVFLPFSAGYFLSYFYRTINAVISVPLTKELGLNASHLGLMTAAYFLAFAAIQLPLGVLLDRFGPRRASALLGRFRAYGRRRGSPMSMG
jgi:sugar phosphate permease